MLVTVPLMRLLIDTTSLWMVALSVDLQLRRFRYQGQPPPPMSTAATKSSNNQRGRVRAPGGSLSAPALICAELSSKWLTVFPEACQTDSAAVSSRQQAAH